jgi:hypothetical protein
MAKEVCSTYIIVDPEILVSQRLGDYEAVLDNLGKSARRSDICSPNVGKRNIIAVLWRRYSFSCIYVDYFKFIYSLDAGEVAQDFVFAFAKGYPGLDHGIVNPVFFYLPRADVYTLPMMLWVDDTDVFLRF